MAVIMLALTLTCQLRPGWLIGLFTSEAGVVAAGAEFLQIISFNFIVTGVVFTCSGMFQAMGNTIPSLAASGTRLVTFVLPAIWMSGQPWFELRDLWYLPVATVTLQAAVAWWLAVREMRIKLSGLIPKQGQQVTPTAV